MNFLDDSLAQYLTPRNDAEDDYDMQPPKTPDYHPNESNNDLIMPDHNEEINEELSPPPSQPKPAKNPSPPKKKKKKNLLTTLFCLCKAKDRLSFFKRH